MHATAYPVFLRAAQYLSHPFDEPDERRLYDELLRLGAILGIRQRDMPRTPEEFWPYFDAMVREELERTAVVAELLDPRRPIPPPDGAGVLLRGSGRCSARPWRGCTSSSRPACSAHRP
ncbi:oxygenase MpaB family protein [Streptomyces sp. INA 01156]